MDIGFAAGTQVIVNNKLKSIEDIATRDKVVTLDGTIQKVQKVASEKSDDIYQLKVLFQPDTKVAGNQRYYVMERMEEDYTRPEWIPSKDIMAGDLVITRILGDSAPVWRPVKDIKKLDEVQTVYSFKTESGSFTANGAVAHD